MQWLFQRIWDDNKVRAPNHRVWWRQGEAETINGWGYREYSNGPLSVWYSAGKRVPDFDPAVKARQTRRIREQQRKA